MDYRIVAGDLEVKSDWRRYYSHPLNDSEVIGSILSQNVDDSWFY